MSIAKAAAKTSKTDLYRTPYECIECLRQFLNPIKNISILDPCDGDGRIRNALRSQTRSVVGFDLYPNHGVSVDFLKHNKHYNLIVGNPPFSLKNEFIRHSIEYSNYTIFLLPVSVVSYNIFHREFLNRPEYVGRILMTPKLFLNEGGTWKPGGTDSYAWFIWSKHNNTKESWERYFDLRKIRSKTFP